MPKMIHVTHKTIEAVRKNHPDEWRGAFDSLPNERIRKTGRPMFSNDDVERLATLAILVDKGMYNDDRMTTDDHKEVNDARN